MLKELALSSNIDINKASLLLNSVGLIDKKGEVIEKILRPVLEDFYYELKHTVSIATNKHSLDLEGIYLFNLADVIKGFPEWLSKRLGVTVNLLDLSSIIKSKNPMPPDVMRSYLTSVGSLI